MRLPSIARATPTSSRDHSRHHPRNPAPHGRYAHSTLRFAPHRPPHRGSAWNGLRRAAPIPRSRRCAVVSVMRGGAAMRFENPATRNARLGAAGHASLTASPAMDRSRDRNRRDLRSGCRRGRNRGERAVQKLRAGRRHRNDRVGIRIDRRQRRRRRGGCGFDSDALDGQMRNEDARKHPPEDIQKAEAEERNHHGYREDAKAQRNEPFRPRLRARGRGRRARFPRPARLRRRRAICNASLRLDPRRLRLDAGLAWLRIALRIGAWIVGSHGFRRDSKLHHAPASVNDFTS